jgi:hypothetical protein
MQALRSMLNQKDMCGGFLERTSTAAAETFHTFQYLYDDFGALNDLRNGYIFALSHHNMDQVMDRSLPQLRNWLLRVQEQLGTPNKHDSHSLSGLKPRPCSSAESFIHQILILGAASAG